MSRTSVIAIALVAVTLILASFLFERRDTATVDPQPLVEVELPGDTIPITGVPEDVATFLQEGRSWRAARALREDFRVANPTPELQLVAARAEAGWGGWSRAEEILDGRDWLDEVRGGEGWYWLGRARDEDGDADGALEAYDRFLSLQSGESRLTAVTHLRRGLVLLREGESERGREALRMAEGNAGGAAEWIELLAIEAAAEAGDTEATAAFVANASDYPDVAYRARRADVEAHLAAGDQRGALAAAERYYGAESNTSRRAGFAYQAGQIARELGETSRAREFFLDALDVTGSTSARQAAGELLEMGGLSRDIRLEIAGVYERHGNASRAAEGFRAWLADEPAGDRRNEVSLRLGRALYNAGSFADAQQVLAPLHDAGPSIAPSALLLTGRSQYRRGQQSQAFSTFEELGRRYPGSAQGAEGLFLVADLSHDDNEMARATATYRDVASRFNGHDRAGLSLMRLAGYAYLNGDFADAAEYWEEYRSTYPSGERWPQSTYWAGKAYQRAGDSERANARFRQVKEREPLSYYALMASHELGVAYWPIPMTDSPTTSPAQAAQVDEWMAGLDLLRDAGLNEEADAEAERLADTAPNSAGIRYQLAEELNERGYAIRGIRIGQGLESGTSQMNPRLLRILYPFPYRDLIEAEAREQGLDPFLVAALTRQESLFTQRISSPVGARGLMQMMPETGAAVARGVGIDEWDAEMLFNPEINVHFGTRYLAEQMERYDGSLPSVFSAYNAGPHRIDAWMSFPEFGDELLFTERIPYRETRDYVKILTRNMALYEGLYGDGDNASAR